MRCVKMNGVIKMEEKVICHQRGKDPLYKTWHASEEHLFMYIHSGKGSIVSGERIFPIEEGALVFIAADTYHYTLPDEPETYDRSKLTVSSQKLTKIAELLQENTTSPIFDKAIVYAQLNACDRDGVEQVFADLARYENHEGNEKILLASLLRLLFFLDKNTMDSTSVVSGTMNKAVRFINENIASDVDIDKICTAINISKYHFCRQFKIHTGMTVMKYILKTRIILAKSDLKNTDLSIIEISEKYGFSSPSYFSRVFKEDTNFSPLQYRKRNTK